MYIKTKRCIRKWKKSKSGQNQRLMFVFQVVYLEQNLGFALANAWREKLYKEAIHGNYP